MASDGIACRILIPNEQLEQVDHSSPPDLLAGFRGGGNSLLRGRRGKGRGSRKWSIWGRKVRKGQRRGERRRGV